MVYLYTYIYHKNQPNVGKYTIYMDPMGFYTHPSIRPPQKNGEFYVFIGFFFTNSLDLKFNWGHYIVWSPEKNW